MIFIKEKKPLNEMSRSILSTPQDSLPFKVVIQSPEHDPPHAHLLEKNSKDKERGEFLIPDRPPKFSGDIQNYQKGISDKDREVLFQWMNKKSSIFAKNTNWEMLTIFWGGAEKI